MPLWPSTYVGSQTEPKATYKGGLPRKANNLPLPNHIRHLLKLDYPPCFL